MAELTGILMQQALLAGVATLAGVAVTGLTRQHKVGALLVTLATGGYFLSVLYVLVQATAAAAGVR